MNVLGQLVSYYEYLVEAGIHPGIGWGSAGVSYALVIDDDGEISDVISTRVERGKETKLFPQAMQVPSPVRRSSDIKPNFLCDNSTFLFGIDRKGNPERARACFEACRKKHMEVLKDAEGPAAKALLAFFGKWDPEQQEKRLERARKEKDNEDPVAVRLNDTIANKNRVVNMVFRYKGEFLQDNKEIRTLWEKYFLAQTGGREMLCIVTGKLAPVAVTHPAIKGLRGTEASGAALVSFNKPAYCSYGKEKGYNAPISQYAAFAYTEALNYLIASKTHTHYIGDLAIVCWAEGGDRGYQGLASMTLFGGPDMYSEKDILDKALRLAGGRPVEFDGTRLDPGRKFYILGLAPKKARVAVQFFYQNSFGALLENVLAHHQRMAIQQPKWETRMAVPLWKMLNETVNKDCDTDKPSKILAKDVLEAVLKGTRYPEALIDGIYARIVAERTVTPAKAAIIKAYYLKNKDIHVPEEVLQVGLNKESANVPYNLGRLFFMLENIQRAANPESKKTIREGFFYNASANPADTFPGLIEKAQYHLAKIGGRLQIELDEEMSDVLFRFEERFPDHMEAPEQLSFMLGYYHQRQEHFEIIEKKKEEGKEHE